MTAVLVAQLVEGGSLRFDTLITEVLPDTTVDTSLGEVTIRDVLGHRTGLVDDFHLRALHEAPDAVAARRQVVDEALRSSAGAPGPFAYANLNYMLAGVIIEELTSAPWNDVVREQLFAPLDMSSCGFGAPTGDLDPLGHAGDVTSRGPDPVGHDGSNTLWYARAVLRPAQRDAVLIASNTREASAVQAIDQLTRSLLRS